MRLIYFLDLRLPTPPMLHLARRELSYTALFTSSSSRVHLLMASNQYMHTYGILSEGEGPTALHQAAQERGPAVDAQGAGVQASSVAYS